MACVCRFSSVPSYLAFRVLRHSRTRHTHTLEGAPAAGLLRRNTHRRLHGGHCQEGGTFETC